MEEDKLVKVDIPNIAENRDDDDLADEPSSKIIEITDQGLEIFLATIPDFFENEFNANKREIDRIKSWFQASLVLGPQQSCPRIPPELQSYSPTGMDEEERDDAWEDDCWEERRDTEIQYDYDDDDRELDIMRSRKSRHAKGKGASYSPY